jgi:hypothetical protein
MRKSACTALQNKRQYGIEARIFVDLIYSELKSSKTWVILHETWSGIRRHPYIISICSLYKISKNIGDVIRTRCQTNVLADTPLRFVL